MSETTQESAGNADVAVAKPAAAQPVVARRDYTLGLFDSDVYLNNDKVARAFGVKAILDKNGAEVGHRYVGLKRKEIANANGLTTTAKDKEKLDGLIRESQEHYLKMFKAWLLMQPEGTLGIARYAFRYDKNGVGTHTVAFKELPPKAQADLQKLADAYGIPIEKLMEHLAKLKAGQGIVEVESTVTSAEAAKGGAKPAGKDK